MSRLACFMIVILTGAAGCAGSKREVSRFPMLTPKRVISSGEEARFAIGYDAAHDRLAIGKTCQLADGGGWEPGVVIIDFHTGRLTARLPVPPKRREQVRRPTGVIFSPSGDRLAVLWENGIDIWDANKNSVLYSITREGVMCKDAVFSHDGKYLFSSAGWPEWTVRRLDMKTREEVAVFRIGEDGLPGSPDYLRLSPDGVTLAISGHRGVVLLDLRGPGVAGRIEAQTLSPNACTFSSDGTRLATGSGTGVELWNVRSRARLAAMPTDGFEANAIAFSPNDRFLAVGGMYAWGMPGVVEVFGLDDNKALATFTCHTNSLATVTFLPRSQEFFTTGFGGDVKVWHLGQWLGSGQKVNSR